MSNLISPKKDITLSVSDDNDRDTIVKISRALSVPERVRILKSILLTPKSLSALSRELDIPVSSVSRHVDALAEAGLIFVNYQPGPKGHTKFCSQNLMSYTVSLGAEALPVETEYSVELPVGMFSHCHIKPPCGMAGLNAIIGLVDAPDTFFVPERDGAECIWFDRGFISYNFPSSPLKHHVCSEITFSFEICSETLYYNNNWPSDITVYINNVEVTTFTSPGDFGGRRGKYTPMYWPITSTQFGLFMRIAVNGEGVFVNNALVHNRVTFDDLDLYNGSSVQLTIGIKEDAEHRGGLNLFGKNFGDYPQAIIMTVK